MKRTAIYPLKLPLVDELVSQHGPPGSPEVVVGVEDVWRSVESVPGRDLNIRDNPNKELFMLYLEASDGDLGSLPVEELGQYEVT